MKKAMLLAGLALLTAWPATARLWNPTPQQSAMDYLMIAHNKGADGRVTLQWVASSAMANAPTMQQMLEKYVVISVAHVRSIPGGGATWDDVQGLQVTDADGKALVEVPQDAYQPSLVGFIATTDAIVRQNTQGKGKTHWGVYEAGSVHACAKGKLNVTYDGETYWWDTPLPGCPKS